MSGFVLPSTTLAEAGLREDQIARLHGLIEAHIGAGRYPGAQIAIARHGKLAHFQSFCCFFPFMGWTGRAIPADLDGRGRLESHLGARPSQIPPIRQGENDFFSRAKRECYRGTSSRM